MSAGFHAITPQGDGNTAGTPPMAPISAFTPLPRKGTETNSGNSGIGPTSFHAITPQGDGNQLLMQPARQRLLQLSRHYPARGRKHSCMHR